MQKVWIVGITSPSPPQREGSMKIDIQYKVECKEIKCVLKCRRKENLLLQCSS